MFKFARTGLLWMGIFFFPFSTFSCAKIDNFESPEFCKAFEEIARCHCTNSGLPSRLCQNVQSIYSRMISTFGSIDKACRFQKDTSQNNCIDAWKCYLQGGELGDGQACSGSRLPCV
jgi:hypothetical protein